MIQVLLLMSLNEVKKNVYRVCVIVRLNTLIPGTESYHLDANISHNETLFREFYSEICYTRVHCFLLSEYYVHFQALNSSHLLPSYK